MNIYSAPLEGITGSVFRTAQNKYFGGITKYFAPFITPTEKGKLSVKIQNDLAPQFNQNQYTVPQILTDNSDGFLFMCKVLEDKYGYTEFNLNLGCPSGTVVSKGRGSGFLIYTDKLDRFLNDIYKSNYTISIKTRIGKESPEEFYKLNEIFNRYPVSELIIHPRTRSDMYKNTPNLDIFKYAVENSKHKLCYNGDIFTYNDYLKFTDNFKNTDTIMLGRGLLINPAFPLEILYNKKADKQSLRDFFFEVMDNYSNILSGDTPVMYKMKELSIYLTQNFKDCEKIAKKLKKAKKITDFKSALYELFSLYELK